MYNAGTDAIDYLTEHVQPLPPSARVRLALVAKLLSDLRAATITVLHGYGTQAAIICSSLYETAFTSVYIGTDDELARRWRDHGKAKPTDSFKSVWSLTEGALRRLGVQDLERLSAARYRIYSELCLAKHNNAVLLAQHVLTKNDKGEVGLLAGPDESDQATRTGSFVLEHGIALTHLAVASLMEDFGGVGARDTFSSKLNDIIQRWKTIAAASRSRWPGGDPFPGKWRTGKKRPPPSPQGSAGG
jgi:hypothetical protein